MEKQRVKKATEQGTGKPPAHIGDRKLVEPSQTVHQSCHRLSPGKLETRSALPGSTDHRVNCYGDPSVTFSRSHLVTDI